MDKNDIRQFLSDRPALSIRAVAIEAGISPALLHRILNETRTLTPTVSAKIQAVAVRYGWSQ